MEDKEKMWLDRLRDYIAKSKDKDVKVCTWWLRLDYGTPTAQINYWLNKSHKKGILGKETKSYYTRFWFIGESEATDV